MVSTEAITWINMQKEVTVIKCTKHTNLMLQTNRWCILTPLQNQLTFWDTLSRTKTPDLLLHYLQQNNNRDRKLLAFALQQKNVYQWETYFRVVEGSNHPSTKL